MITIHTQTVSFDTASFGVTSDDPMQAASVLGYLLSNMGNGFLSHAGSNAQLDEASLDHIMRSIEREVSPIQIKFFTVYLTYDEYRKPNLEFSVSAQEHPAGSSAGHLHSNGT